MFLLFFRFKNKRDAYFIIHIPFLVEKGGFKPPSPKVHNSTASHMLSTARTQLEIIRWGSCTVIWGCLVKDNLPPPGFMTTRKTCYTISPPACCVIECSRYALTTAYALRESLYMLFLLPGHQADPVG